MSTRLTKGQFARNEANVYVLPPSLFILISWLFLFSFCSRFEKHETRGDAVTTPGDGVPRTRYPRRVRDPRAKVRVNTHAPWRVHRDYGYRRGAEYYYGALSWIEKEKKKNKDTRNNVVALVCFVTIDWTGFR